MKTSLYYSKRGQPGKWEPVKPRKVSSKPIEQIRTEVRGSKTRTTAAEMWRFKAWLENEHYKVIDSKTVGVLFSVYKSGAYRQVRCVDDYHYELGCGLKSLYADFLRSSGDA